jgi:hypothetical protein
LLRWTDVASNETGYEIDRATCGGAFANIATTAANVETYTDTGLTPGTCYEYRIRAIGASAVASSLDDVDAYWLLDEASGTRFDAVGSQDLTDNATVTQAAGRNGTLNAAQFTRANSEYLSVTDSATLSHGDIDFTMVAWVYLDSKANNLSIVTKWTGTGDQREWILIYLGGATDRFHFSVSSDGTAGTASTINADTYGAVATGAWNMVVVKHDAAADTINISVNAGAFDSAAHTGGAFDGSGAMNMGATEQALDFFDGRIDGVGIWKRALTAAEITALYLAGAGDDYTFIPATVADTPSSYSATRTVVTQSCQTTGSPFHKEIVLPRFDGDVQQWQTLLNEMAQKLETNWNEQVATKPTCTACAENGAVVLDCNRCEFFAVATDSDINSITMDNCKGDVDVRITNTGTNPITVTGWPSTALCVEGDPCSQVIPPGQITNVGFHCAAGICLEADDQDPFPTGGGILSLAIQCEQTVDDGIFGESNPGTFDCVQFCCSTACADRKINLRASGGVAPYTWSSTNGDPDEVGAPVLTPDSNGKNVTITPPANTGTGTAYFHYVCAVTVSTNQCAFSQRKQTFDCDDLKTADTNHCAVTTQVCPDCCDGSPTSCDGAGDAGPCTGCPSFSHGSSFDDLTADCTGIGCTPATKTCGAKEDQRNQTQKDAGCAPCGVTMEGVVVTVEDAIGNQASITIVVGA